MFRIFNVNKWSKLERSLEQKPNILLSQFSIFAVIGALMQVVHDALNENNNAVLLDFVIVFIFVATFLLNERRKHLLAKFMFIGLGTGFIFIYASIVPKEVGAYFVFFPIITLTFLIFNNEERQYKYVSVFYIVVLLLILEPTGYQPFGNIDVTEGIPESSSFYVNLFIGIFGVLFSMYSIDTINEQMEQARLSALEELEEKNKELELANDELDHFVYSASHDLKSPLSSILGLINIAKYEVQNEIVLDYFQRIENRVDRLIIFIKEVIEISKNTRTELKSEPISLNEMLDEIIENNNYIDGIGLIDFQKKLEFDTPLYSDRARLEVVLNNLISNAIKYSDPKKQQSTISIEAKKVEKDCVISICDNGIGIPENQQEKVFEMFYRGAQNVEGSGLGLYIVKNMLVKLNGEFDLKSEEGKGTFIELKIPCQM